MSNEADVSSNAFAAGFFEVLGALLSSPVTFEVGPPRETTSDVLAESLTLYPVVLHGTVNESTAPVVVLFALKDALRMAGLVYGNAAGATGDHLADHDLATLEELAGHALKGGLEGLSAERGVAWTLGDVKVAPAGPVTTMKWLAPLLGGASDAMDMRLASPPELDTEAVLFLPRATAARASAASATEPRPAKEAAATAFTDPNPKKELGAMPDTGRPSREPADAASGASNLDMILDIRLVVRARLGRVEMPIADILTLGPGSIVEVGHMLDEPVDLLVNDKLIARGDVVVVDEKFGLRITEIVSPRERIESLR